MMYLCIDLSGGMCDRICLGEQAVINNANVSIECWNSGQSEEHYEYVKDIKNAFSILSTDNFLIEKMEAGKVYFLGDVLIKHGGNNLVSYVDVSPVRVINTEDINFNDNGMYNIY